MLRRTPVPRALRVHACKSYARLSGSSTAFARRHPRPRAMNVYTTQHCDARYGACDAAGRSTMPLRAVTKREQHLCEAVRTA